MACDANGELPPVSRLIYDQSMYHFVSGYTAKVAGTEVGVTDPIAIFSACFGEAFLPKYPYLYAKMLAEKVEKHGVHVWLVNTGWTGGKYGVCKRMSLKDTRQIIDNIHDGSLEKEEFEIVPGFNLHLPTKCNHVDSLILNSINAWKHKSVLQRRQESWRWRVT